MKPAQILEAAKQFVGKPLAVLENWARTNDFTVRVKTRNGQPWGGIHDYNPTRINVGIVDDVVTEVQSVT